VYFALISKRGRVLREKKLKLVAVFSIALMSILASYTLLSTVHAVTVSELLRLGRPIVVRIPLSGPAFSYIDDASGDVVLVHVSDNGVQVASYLQPFANLEEVRLAYPLQGSLVHVALSSDPSPSAIAFASSQGEILVLYHTGGRLLYGYIQAKDEEVLKTRISVNGNLLALFADSSLRVYSVKRGGWFEIGPITGNSSYWSKTGRGVYSAEMLAVLGGDRVSYQDRIIDYESVEEFPSLIVMRLAYFNGTVLVPVSSK